MNSVWGRGDPATLKLLKKTLIKGHWLNLAAGDGRYNNLFLQNARVTATDIDPKSLRSLRKKTPNRLSKKLGTKKLDFTKKFAFKNNSFDGVFCAGTLHLFKPKTIKKIIREITRILKPNGVFIFDFATDAKRIKANGTRFVYKKNAPEYSFAQAKKLLEKLLADYSFSLQKSRVLPEKIKLGKTGYTFSCNFALVRARKNS